MEEIQLNKPPTAHLGFSIAGGISHEHVKGFDRIFQIEKCFRKKYFLGIMEFLLQI